MNNVNNPFQALTPCNQSREESATAEGFENRAWALCLALHPNDITLGRDPLITLPNKQYRPDVFAMFDHFGLLIEATYTTEHNFISEELSRLEEVRTSLERLLRRDFNNRKLVCLLFIKDKEALRDSIISRAKAAKVKIISERELNYYLTLHRKVGLGIYQLFFSRFAPSVLEVSNIFIPAIRIKEGRQIKYIFSVNPHELMKRAFISHRELHAQADGDLGYQRMLRKKKLREIAKYIKAKKSFPSPIIVSFQKNAGEQFSEPKLVDKKKGVENVEVGELKLPSKPASIYIVDGQHRLYGYSLLEPSDKHHINVIAYKGLKPSRQASMFVDINLKQTKVPSTLLWELYPDILNQTDDDYYKAVISRTVEKLVESHLFGKVKHTSSGSKGPMTFHAICNEIARARLLSRGGAGVVAELEGQDWEALEDRLHTILVAFIESLEGLGKDHPEVNSRFFFQNSGIIPLIRELGKICRHLKLQDPSILRAAKSNLRESFDSYFKLLFEFYDTTPEQLDDLTKKRVGSSGFIETEDEMDDVIRVKYPSFPLRPKRIPPELEKAVARFTSLIQEINKVSQDKKGQWIFRQYDKEGVIKALSKPARDHSGFEKVVNVVYQELVESSGHAKGDNRAAKMLGYASINDIKIMKNLSLLRHLSAHRASQLDPSRRKRGLLFLSMLSARQDIRGFYDLTAEDCLRAQIKLLDKLADDFLEILLRKASE